MWQHGNYSQGLWQPFAHNSASFLNWCKLVKCKQFVAAVEFGPKQYIFVFTSQSSAQFGFLGIRWEF